MPPLLPSPLAVRSSCCTRWATTPRGEEAVASAAATEACSRGACGCACCCWWPCCFAAARGLSGWPLTGVMIGSGSGRAGACGTCTGGSGALPPSRVSLTQPGTSAGLWLPAAARGAAGPASAPIAAVSSGPGLLDRPPLYVAAAAAAAVGACEPEACDHDSPSWAARLEKGEASAALRKLLLRLMAPLALLGMSAVEVRRAAWGLWMVEAKQSCTQRQRCTSQLSPQQRLQAIGFHLSQVHAPCPWDALPRALLPRPTRVQLAVVHVALGK